MPRINVGYDFYTNAFEGTVIPESAFKKVINEAEAFVGKITFNRIHRHSLKPDDLTAVKCAICAVAEVAYRMDVHRDVKSESNDGYSITYTDGSESSRRGRMIEAADIYLSETTLRNRMVSYDYEC